MNPLSFFGSGPNGMLFTDGTDLFLIWHRRRGDNGYPSHVRVIGMKVDTPSAAFPGGPANYCGVEMDMRQDDDDPMTEEAKELGQRAADALNRYYAGEEKRLVAEWAKRNALSRNGRRRKRPSMSEKRAPYKTYRQRKADAAGDPYRGARPAAKPPVIVLAPTPPLFTRYEVRHRMERTTPDMEIGESEVIAEAELWDVSDPKDEFIVAILYPDDEDRCDYLKVAHLFAAAPEMERALKRIAEAMECGSGEPVTAKILSDDTWNPQAHIGSVTITVEDARAVFAALKKATGKAAGK